MIHNFAPNGMMMLGADHEVESVLEDIDQAERLAVFTKECQNMGHSLALIKNNKLECYDVGVIMKVDLEVVNQDKVWKDNHLKEGLKDGTEEVDYMAGC